MRSFLLIIFFAFAGFVSVAQKDSSYLIIEDAIRSRGISAIVIYTDSAINFYETFSRYVRRGAIEGYKDSFEVRMNFSRKEAKLIDKEFTKSYRIE